MKKEIATHLLLKPVSASQHMMLNLRNFNYFRVSNEGKTILFFGRCRLLTLFIAIPYIVSSELVFFRTARYYALHNDQIAGILVVQAEPETLYVNNLAVAPEYRRHGVATAMLSHCARIARRIGKTSLELSVLKTNTAARHLYEKSGFFIKENRRWSYILRKNLNTSESQSGIS